MSALMKVTMFCYLLLLVLMGIALTTFAFQLVSVSEIVGTIRYIYNVQGLRMFMGAIGTFLILLSVLLFQATMGRLQREKTIAFTNPNGQVTIALTAIEDFVKRIAGQVSEVKDLRSNVIAGKKGIEVSARLALWQDSNIPEVTEKLQALLRTRLQEMLGIEEAIQVKMHVVKIAQREVPAEK